MDATAPLSIQALDWLDTNIKPLLATRTVKRLAFRVLAGESDMIITATMMGKSSPEYALVEDQGQNTVDVNGKPTGIVAPPDNLEDLEALLAGAEIRFPTEHKDQSAKPEDPAPEVEPPHEPETPEFAPVERTVDLNVGETAPTPIPMPTGVKKTRKKADQRSLREKLLSKMCAELGVQIPDPDEMFRKFKDNPAVRFVKFTELAACNHPQQLMHSPKGETAKALAESMEYHRDNDIRNILNLSAEIDPNRVMALVGTLLRYRKLIMCIEAAHITDTPPSSALVGHDGKGVEPYNEKALQIWSGRHRAWALAFIYGNDVELPVMISDMDYPSASRECVESNKCRPMGKQEQIHYEAVQRSLMLGDNPTGQFGSLKGDKKKIANFVVYHTLVAPESEVFLHPEYLKIGAKRTPKNITLPFYKSAIEFALTGAGLNHATALDAKTTNGINLIVKALDTLFSRIEQEFSLDAERKLVWTYYSAGAYGMLLGEALYPYIHGKKDGTAAVDAAESVISKVLGLFRDTDVDTAKQKLAKEPPASLTAILSMYGDTEESESSSLEG